METLVSSRADIFSPQLSPSIIAEDGLNVPYQFDFDIVDVVDTVVEDAPPSHEDEKREEAGEEKEREEEQSHCFRLFSSSTAPNVILLPHGDSNSDAEQQQPRLTITTTAAATVELSAEEIREVAGYGEDEIAASRELHRPDGYYRVTAVSAAEQKKRKDQFTAAAVSGEDVINGTTQVFWSCKVPWKVIPLLLVPVDKSKGSAHTSSSITGIIKGKEEAIRAQAKPAKAQLASSKEELVTTAIDKAKRRRPNKKRRIFLRKKRAAEAAALEKKQAKKDRKKAKKADIVNRAGRGGDKVQAHKRTDEEERDKRTRMNRLKKVRRKQKLKAKAEEKNHTPD